MLLSCFVDGDKVLYYWRIVNNSASGTTKIVIPASLAAGNYVLRVFNEQIMGDKKSDYASDFRDISLSVRAGPTIRMTPVVSFPVGGAPDNLTVQVGNTGSVPSTGDFGSLDMSADGMHYSPVEPENYSVTYHSIHIALDQQWLNTLAPGQYTLRVNLAGAFEGTSLTTWFSVAAPDYGEEGPVTDVPKTGDSTPLALLCGLVLLCGAGLAVRRRKRRG